MESVLSRGACPYCGAGARPNSLYCLDCGQVVAVASAAPARRGATWEPPQAAHAPAPAAEPHVVAGGAFAVPAAIEQSAPVLRRRAPAQTPTLPEVRLAETDRSVVLVFSTGETARVRGAAVIGRSPEDVARNSGRQPVRLADDTRSLSRAHAMIDLTGDHAYVFDAGSANGSLLERDGVQTPLSDEPQRLVSGDRLWFGDVAADVTIVGAR